MSHLITMIQDGENLLERFEKAHAIFMMDYESTAEIIMWNDAETVEKLMKECKHLVEQLPPEFKDWTFDKIYTVNHWLDGFMNGFDEFIVNCYRGQHSVEYVNGVRTLLHYGELFLAEKEENLKLGSKEDKTQ